MVKVTIDDPTNHGVTCVSFETEWEDDRSTLPDWHTLLGEAICRALLMHSTPSPESVLVALAESACVFQQIMRDNELPLPQHAEKLIEQAKAYWYCECGDGNP